MSYKTLDHHVPTKINRLLDLMNAKWFYWNYLFNRSYRA